MLTFKIFVFKADYPFHYQVQLYTCWSKKPYEMIPFYIAGRTWWWSQFWKSNTCSIMNILPGLASTRRRPLHYLKVKLFALRGIFLILPWSLVKVSNHWQHLSSENPCGLAGKNCRVTYNDTNNLHFGWIVEPPEHTKF